MSEEKTAIIIGAGPAGLTAALELLRRTNITPIILEASHEIGGISRTIRYKGNRMDIGGHRFFSKSDRVMNWWMELMPVSQDAGGPSTHQSTSTISYHGQSRKLPVTSRRKRDDGGPAAGSAQSSTAVLERTPPIEPPERDEDLVMLIRPRKSRIYYLRRFFDYPIKLTGATLKNLGIARSLRIAISYVASRVRQIKPERNLEEFLINRFGRELYLTFFKSYTEKVWGTPCREISAEWGAQRIKGLNLTSAIKHFVRTKLTKTTAGNAQGIGQKDIDTSLIERFMYPKLGPGQLWEHVAQLIETGVAGPNGVANGEIRSGMRVTAVHCRGKQVVSVEATDDAGKQKVFPADYVFSTMPMRELVEALDAPAPDAVKEVSEGLQYRDFITIGLLADRLKVTEVDGTALRDNWIYIQEPDVLLGRLQVFNNWSPYLVADPKKVWIGLEYFCYETDNLWQMDDKSLERFAIAEVEKIGILQADAVSDAHVVRVPKTYPAYFGTYDRFDKLKCYTDSFENLFLIGRNGMHKYNNQDHSMLTAMTVVDGLVAGYVDKAALWNINTEQSYHEEKR